MQNDFVSIWKTISQSKSVLIIVPGKEYAYASLLGMSLQTLIKLNITDVSVRLYNLYPISEQIKLQIDKDVFSDNLGEKELVVSFDITKEKIEKISYDDNSEKLNIIVQSKQNVPAIHKKQVSFNYRGINADLLIILGMDNLKMMQELALKEPDLLQRNVICWGYKDLFNVAILHKIITPINQLSSQFVNMVQVNELNINPQIIRDMFNALKVESKKFSLANADIFQAAAWLMRSQEMSVQSVVDLNPNFQKSDSNKQVTPLLKSQDKVDDWIGPKIFKSST